ncbi:MAG: hypothetical protein ACE37F_27740 [Nannocystaceae bacterium]|nr:hypothetical protein [bacterium]
MRLLGLLFGLLLSGCFADPASTPAACEDGSNGCRCYGNSSCDGQLQCNADGNCVDPQCEEGSALCPCYGNGTCDGTLMCTDDICRPVDAATSNASGSESETTTPGTSTTGPAESTAGESGETSVGGTVTSGATTGVSESCLACDPDQVCRNRSCDRSPYTACGPGLPCPANQECFEADLGGLVCAPQCAKNDDCPALVGDAYSPPVCNGGLCKLPCLDEADCPPSAPRCESSNQNSICVGV